MSTIVCQNLISCFESQLTETTTTLKLKVIKTGMIEDHQSQGQEKPKHEFNNWGNFLQTTPKETTEKADGGYYALKNTPSYSRLSAKSLEMCTENLGSETGADIITDSSSIFSSFPYNPTSEKRENYTPLKRAEPENPRKSTKNPRHQKTNKNDFPPPLTTMSGSSSLQVRRHTEGGRLIIEAVEAPFRNSYLQAERCNGRLRLCFQNTAETTTTSTLSEGHDEQEEDEGIEEPIRSELESEEEQEQEQEQFDSGGENEINHVEMGNIHENFQWMSSSSSSRCKEGRHGNKAGLCCPTSSNWKPAALCVATS